MTNPSTLLAREVVSALLARGVRDVVVAPGSRNAPLSFALYDAASAGRLRLHTRIDERSGGFLALGLGKTGPPAAMVCTSGTAVANLHPAVLEAAHAGVELIVVTADRPARLRGTNANQTTDQRRIFGDAATFLDLAAGDEIPVLAELAAGPLHLNVQFDDPLLPADRWDVAPSSGTDAAAWTRAAVPTDPVRIPLGPRTVVVAGDDAGPPARTLAEKANWPLFAEPSSGSRTGDNALRTYRLLLGDETEGALAQQIERVIVFGHPTLSRPVQRLLNREDVEVWAAPARGIWSERPFAVDRPLARAVPDESAEPEATEWLEEWRAADRDRGRALDVLLRDESTLTPQLVAGSVANALPEGGLLVVGASSPIRDLDLMVPRYEVGRRRKVIANRGLAGIDGTISTAIGAALGRTDSTRNLALLGDVTFLHDSNGLILGPQEPRPDLTIVVVNDDGGAIFTMLEQGAEEYADRFETLFGTPHGVDLASLCAATRTPHWRVETRAELDHALASPNGGIEVIEAVCRRDNRRDLDERIRSLGSPG